MLARAERVNGQTMVQVMSEHHRHRVYLIVLQQLGVRGVAPRDFEVPHEPRPPLLQQVRHGDDPNVIKSGDGLAVGPRNPAQTNDPDR